MKHMTGSARHYFIQPIFRRSPALIVRTTVLLVVCLSILALVGSALAKTVDEPALPEPFSAFADVYPGQSVDPLKLEARGFACRDNTLPSPADISQDCQRTLPGGMFSQINLMIWDGVVQRLDLKVRENGLNIGDLALRWGSRGVRIAGNWVSLSRLRITSPASFRIVSRDQSVN